MNTTLDQIRQTADTRSALHSKLYSVTQIIEAGRIMLQEMTASALLDASALRAARKTLADAHTQVSAIFNINWDEYQLTLEQVKALEAAEKAKTEMGEDVH